MIKPSGKTSFSTLRVAYYGEEGSFSHLVATKRFSSFKGVPSPTISQAFEELLQNRVDRIVVPIENATVGIISGTADRLISLALHQEPFHIEECLTMPVEFALMAPSSVSKINRIYSHFSPFGHAQKWLEKNYPKAQQIVVESTAEAARKVCKLKNSAAIAGVHTAKLYGLRIHNRGLGSEISNQTSFFVISKEPPPSKNLLAKATHTSIMFELAHRPRALVKALKTLGDHAINLTRVESRPIPGKFSQYRFLIEVEKTPSSSIFKKALEGFKKATSQCYLLGSYAKKKI